MNFGTWQKYEQQAQVSRNTFIILIPEEVLECSELNYFQTFTVA